MTTPKSKRRRLREALLTRARFELGPDVTALDFIEQFVSRGGKLSELARSLQAEMGESVSRGFLSMIVQRLAPDAPTRIAEARLAPLRKAHADALRTPLPDASREAATPNVIGWGGAFGGDFGAERARPTR